MRYRTNQQERTCLKEKGLSIFHLKKAANASSLESLIFALVANSTYSGLADLAAKYELSLDGNRLDVFAYELVCLIKLQGIKTPECLVQFLVS